MFLSPFTIFLVANITSHFKGCSLITTIASKRFFIKDKGEPLNNKQSGTHDPLIHLDIG